jgi:hypothetical protein
MTDERHRPPMPPRARVRDGLVLLRTNTSELGKVTWSGIDLATGAVRWSLRQPVRGLITEADYVDDFPRYLVSATETGDLAVRDAVTGAVLATARVPVRHRAVGADVSVWPTDDLVLVGAPDGTNAYALPDLVQRWHSVGDLAGRWVQSSCGTAICSLSWRGGLVAMDPLTGRRLWADRRWTYADQVGRYLLTTENAAADVPRTVSVVDPVTGAVRGTFGRWHTVGAARPDGTVVGLRSAGRDDPADTVWYAVLDPATLQTRLLGRAEDVSGDCQTAADVLVCRRIDASAGLWRLK